MRKAYPAAHCHKLYRMKGADCAEKVGAALLALAAMALSASAMAAETKPAFRIVDSGYVVDRLPPNVFGWADSRRFVFQGVRQGEQDQAELASPLVKIWDTTKNTVTPYKNLHGACFKGGKIRYGEGGNDPAKSGKYIWWEGPIGEERRSEEPYKRRTKEEGPRAAVQVVSPFHCRTVRLDELSPPAKDSSRKLVALRDDDGYLDMGSRDILELVRERAQGKTVQWYHQRHPRGIPLPIPLAEEPGVPGYSAMKSTYMIFADLGAPLQVSADQRWEKRIPSRYYKFDPMAGKVVAVDVPNFGQDSSVGRLAPTRMGWVFSGSATPWRQRSGVYSFDGNNVVLREQGLVSALAVSPDGCKAAYSINTEHAQMGGRYRVKYMDLCQ